MGSDRVSEFQLHPDGSLVLRVVRSMHEPRVVTAIMVAVYLLTGLGLAIWIPVSPGPTPPLQAIAAVSLAAAGLIGIPSAWAGWRGTEKYALLFLTLGWVLMGVDDLQHAMLTDQLVRAPGTVLISSAGVALWSLKRYRTIRGETWAAGREPDTSLTRVRRAVDAESLLVLDAERERRRSQEGGYQ